MRTAWIVTVTLLFSITAAPQAGAVDNPPGECQGKAGRRAGNFAPSGPDSTTKSFGDWAMVLAAPAAGASERPCEVNTTLTIRGHVLFGRTHRLRAADRRQPTRVVAVRALG